MKFIPLPTLVVVLVLAVASYIIFDINKTILSVSCLIISAIILIELYAANRRGNIYNSKTTTAWLFSASHGDWSSKILYDRSINPGGFNFYFRIHSVLAILYLILGIISLFNS